MRSFAILACLVIVFCGPTVGPARASDRVTLAVLDLRGKGVPQDLVENLTDVVTVSLSKLDVFHVLSRADIQQMLAFEENKQMMGCESDTTCLAEIGGALGVALLVNGSIGKVGSNFIINLTLTDTSTVTVKAREHRQVASEDELAPQMEAASRFLVRELLEGQQGYLILKASENGADVEVDGRIVGVTPLSRQTLSGGPHTVKVLKKGFIAWAKDVNIEKEQPAIIDASLVPSLEFIDDYDARAGRWRMLSYLTGGLGLAAVSFGIGGWVWNGQRASQFERDVTAANCQEGASGAPVDDCAALENRRESIKRFDLIAQVAGLGGAAFLGIGLYLFIEGPTPGVYDQYRPDSGAGARLEILPLPGGAAAQSTFRF